jgi:hypothetical protein
VKVLHSARCALDRARHGTRSLAARALRGLCDTRSATARNDGERERPAPLAEHDRVPGRNGLGVFGFNARRVFVTRKSDVSKTEAR